VRKGDIWGFGSIENCLIYINEFLCGKCEDGYYRKANTNGIIGNRCIKCHESLENCNFNPYLDKIVIKKCKPIYDLELPTTNKCDLKDPKCLEYLIGTKRCKKCENNYYLALDGESTCIQCPENCAQCVSKKGCVNCFEGYYLKKDHKNQSICLPCLKNCEKCLNEDYCLNCSKNFILINKRKEI
jgi:hypothetical protein